MGGAGLRSKLCTDTPALFCDPRPVEGVVGRNSYLANLPYLCEGSRGSLGRR